LIKATIVDDEPPARRELRRLLADCDDVSVVGEAGDLNVARGLLLRTRPDVVFLDIMLGRTSGFDLLPDIDEETAVVFVTAYGDHAVKAFEASALDYLLKPVDSARLISTVERVRARLEKAGSESVKPSPLLYSAGRWVFVDSGGKQEFIEIANITHVAPDGGATRVYTEDGRSRVTSRTLADWEQRLDNGDFVRVHRSAIVNLKHVERIEPWFQYSYRVRMRGFAEPVVMSRRHANRLKDTLG
jgi:two-component system LytT family response regulator